MHARHADRGPLVLGRPHREAAALALEPSLLIADEPVSMLDVSIRADILNLLSALAREQGIAVVMITHDLSTVAAYADRIAVMYMGRIVEHGPTREVLRDPQHPYARALLSVVPIPDPALVMKLARRGIRLLTGSRTRAIGPPGPTLPAVESNNAERADTSAIATVGAEDGGYIRRSR